MAWCENSAGGGTTAPTGQNVGSEEGDEARAKAQTCNEPVVFIANGLGPGGAERQLVYLSSGLRRRGWDVRILILTPVVHPEFAQRLREAGISVEILQPAERASLGGLYRALRQCFRKLLAIRPAVIVGFLVHGALFARIIGRLAAVPTVLTSLRTSRSTRLWHDWLLALTRRLDDAMITNSTRAAQEQIRARVTSAEKSIVVHNGFDLSRVPDLRSRAESNAAAEFTWLSIARFRREKTHWVLLRAAKIISERRSFRLLLAGDGPELEPMKALADRLGIGAIVHFLGKSDEVSELIRTSDAFVLGSRDEGLPNGLIEALAGGLPAVTTDVGGCRELIEPGRAGWLVPPDDPPALAQAMMRMMDLPPEERCKMGEGGRHYVLGNLTMDAMISRWETVLMRKHAGVGH